MAVVQIPNLPPVLGLRGEDLFEIVQIGVSCRASINQIAYYTNIFPPNTVPVGNFLTNRQFRSALAAIPSPSPNALIEVDNNIPADISDAVNIEWNHGNWVVEGDDVYLFVQSVLGYTSAQMLALMASGNSYPL